MGYINISDQLKEEAKDVIKNLPVDSVVMLTGDNALSARYIADQVGIDIVISEVLPEGKYEIIERIKQHTYI